MTYIVRPPEGVEQSGKATFTQESNRMNTVFRRNAFVASVGALTLVVVLGACAGLVGGPIAGIGSALRLTGEQEVPPVSTYAAGIGRIMVAADGAVSGSISTTGLAATVAHIHLGNAGVNGPAIIPLGLTAEGVWSVPSGAHLTSAQMGSYRSGGLYVNVHTEAHKGGEIRTQLRP